MANRMLFEVSWEVCNMVGGIHTVISTKAQNMQDIYGENYVTIGPDISQSTSLAGIFAEEAWNPDFLKSLSALNIPCRMGRWLVPGEPKCLLIQFNSLFEQKDQILAKYWERFGLNSLFGGHDYLEPLLFGEAAGMVIEKLFFSHLLDKDIEAIVHCHEWLTCGALLYLKDRSPEIGTVFTTHATILGRTLSANRGQDNFETHDHGHIEFLAKQHGVPAKHSLESVSANLADCFTTVSEITAQECEKLLKKRPDLLLLNGLSENLPSPAFSSPEAVARTRTRLLQIASLTTGHSYTPEKTVMFVSAGRYEFHNKGIDITLETMARLNAKLKEPGPLIGTKIVHFLMFPAGHTGPRPQILAAYQQGTAMTEHFFSTHGLREEQHDPIMTRMAPLGFRNGKDDPVHIVFVPIYLNGNDPLIAETYYQLLAGTDLSLFPSFYEPWGYTPQESVALGVPTICSDLAGYGLWAKQFGGFSATGVCVLNRSQASFEETSDELLSVLEGFLKLNPDEKANLKRATAPTAQHSRWSEFAQAYVKAHEAAMTQAKRRMDSATYDRFRAFSASYVVTLKPGAREGAHIRRLTVVNKFPPLIERLRAVVHSNLWWSWTPEYTDLLSEFDPGLWVSCHNDPLKFIDRLSPETLARVVKSKHFSERAEILLSRFSLYMSTKPEPEIAYFCLEFGLTHVLRLYSGGLGILAGDHLKTASDMGIPLCAFGLAYKYGYFTQRITADGKQEAAHEPSEFSTLPMQPLLDADGERIRFTVDSPTGEIWLQAWKIAVGRVDLYLLDTDISENKPEDRSITDQLYGGDRDHRLRQEFVLTTGGFKLQKVLGIKPSVFHMNEGHTAFLVIVRIIRLMQEEKLGFEEALEYVRHTMGFTTHTPVPAGHDQFPDTSAGPYLDLLAKQAGVNREKLQELGKSVDKARENVFSMTLLALRGSGYVNGVSKIHGGVSRRMFHSLVSDFHVNEVPVQSVTNGVHAGTWIAPEWQLTFAKLLGADWRDHLTDVNYWDQVRHFDADIVWHTHMEAKSRLISWLKRHLRETWERRREHPASLASALANLSEDTFIATFARRFAPYKRANLLFRDPARLTKLLAGNVPIVFLFAGKAHPSDGHGKNLISEVVGLARRPEFFGRILFVENYEIDIAQLLVSGSDLWINNPVRPLEASGTSGMKAAMNGCLNLSVPDGWWAEAYNGKNGWVIGDDTTTQSPDFQDTFDSSLLYALLEREVLPRYSSHDGKDVPERWVKMMKESIASILPRFNTERMLADYDRELYKPSINCAAEMSTNHFEKVRALSATYSRLTQKWASISFVDIDASGLEGESATLGQTVKMKVRVQHPDLKFNDIQVQTVISNDTDVSEASVFQTYPMSCVQPDTTGAESTWETTLKFEQTGLQLLGVRVVPHSCHDNHRVHTLLNLVKWL